jgi:hypothetical protein
MRDNAAVPSLSHQQNKTKRNKAYLIDARCFGFAAAQSRVHATVGTPLELNFLNRL